MRIYNTTVNRRSLIRWKIYIDRSRMYMGYINFFLLGYVSLQTFKGRVWADYIFDNPLIFIPLAVILFIILSLVLGFLDSKLGFREEELRNSSKSNPVMMEMLDELRDINKKLESKDNSTIKN